MCAIKKTTNCNFVICMMESIIAVLAHKALATKLQVVIVTHACSYGIIMHIVTIALFVGSGLNRKEARLSATHVALNESEASRSIT